MKNKIEIKLDEMLLNYEDKIKENFKMKYKKYFVKFENSISLIEARERYIKAKNKNKELYEDFVYDIKELLNETSEIDKKQKSLMLKKYKVKFLSIVNEINDKQYKIFNNFVKKIEKR